jgi:hypothetical protein
LEWASGVSPQKYRDAASYFADAQVSGLIKKVPFPTDLIDLKPAEAALEKFMAAEYKCQLFNEAEHIPLPRSLVLHAREYIKRVIGVAPVIEDILDESLISTGASVGVHGNKTNIARKILADTWSCTPAALPYAMEAFWRNDHLRGVMSADLPPLPKEIWSERFRAKVKLTNSNKLSYVPKTAKIHRIIAVEPLLNSFLQKGVDKFMKRRLKSVCHIDLYDQSRNQDMARLGSLPCDDPYCTIDLEAASDSLSKRIVKLLLPPEWWEFLLKLRTPQYELDGEYFTYSKFCSMGNGFCFPLESLIFAAITHAAHYRYDQPIPDLRFRKMAMSSKSTDFSVYGDDIVVRTRSVHQVIGDLQLAGFTINSEKSFVEGPFRESCGADWYLGQDVRPVNLTKWISNFSIMYALHNAFLRSRVTELASCETRKFLVKRVPDRWRLMRPGREPGDTCFSVPLDVAMANPYVSFANQRWRWWEWAPYPIEDEVVLAKSGISVPLMYTALNGGNSDKPFVLRYAERRRRVRVSRWNSDAYHAQSFSSIVATA